jgi:hypothetical protein
VNTFYQMTQFYCRAGYRKYVEQAFADYVVMNYNPKGFLSRLVNIVFPSEHELGKYILIKWVAEISLALFNEPIGISKYKCTANSTDLGPCNNAC